MRILISAYACEPSRGSEPGVGWNWAVQTALRGHEVVVITRENNRSAIETELAMTPIPNLRFHYLDLPKPLLGWKRRLGYYGLHSYYYLWQVWLWFVARRLHRQTPFDLVHHVTFVNDWMPSGVAGVDALFIWGPVGGSTHVAHPALRRAPTASERRYEWSRRALQGTLHRFDPLVALTRRRAALILTYTNEALAGIPFRHRHKARPIVHIGVTERDAPEYVPASSHGPLVILAGGRLVHWKGFDLLLEGFAECLRSARTDARLVLTGDGPARTRLGEAVRKLGITQHVRFTGRLPERADVYRELAQAQLYALPTLRDGPPTAILEAMLAGRAVLCLDHGATREMVPDAAGMKIPVSTRSQVVADIASNLSWAAAHRAEVCEMGSRGREFALDVHHWHRIGDEIEAIHQSVASGLPGGRPAARKFVVRPR